jgi:hypothetical protein
MSTIYGTNGVPMVTAGIPAQAAICCFSATVGAAATEFEGNM